MPIRWAMRRQTIMIGGRTTGRPGAFSNPPENEVVGHFEHETQKPAQGEQVDEDIGAEAQEGVPIPALIWRRAMRVTIAAR